MANDQHVEIVKQGRAAIDEWRATHPKQHMDLDGIDLEDADMRGADLSGFELNHAQLSRAKLEHANLDFAELAEVVLFYADLTAASLRGAELVNANLTGATLHQADLTDANLDEANLSHTDLTEAILTEATLNGTIFADLDLSGAVGLDRVIHQGPSTIDERTLRKSWPLPEVFLKGVGLSDNLITYLPSLMNQAIEFYSCFISYSSKDDEFARRLHADLQDNGVRCWFAPDDLRTGDRFRVRIDEAIRVHDKLLLILSEHSVNSAWVEYEVDKAITKELKSREGGNDPTVLFPIQLDSAVDETDTALATTIKETWHVGNFTDWEDHDAYQTAFERLLRDLRPEPKPTAEGD